MINPIDGLYAFKSTAPAASDVNAVLSNLSGEPEDGRDAIAQWASINFRRNSRGTAVKDLHNVALAIRNAPELKGGAIALNELSDEVEFTRAVDFGDVGYCERFEAAQKVETDEILQLRSVLNKMLGVDFGTQLVYDGLRTVAYDQRFNPIREYLETLAWDGVPRIDRWLTIFAHADDNEYTRAVASKWLIQAVARGYKPGCAADSMLVLEGEQGSGKNAMMQALVPNDKWCVTLHSCNIDKDTVVSLEGKWIAEFAEMITVKAAETNALKAFITQRVDNYRKAYRRDHVDHKRSCVLWGGTNQSTYLQDETGNRRFWPVKVKGFIQVEDKLKLDRDGIERDRDQLWAEAVVRYHRAESYLLSGKENNIAEEEQAARLVIDEWEQPILAHLQNVKDFTTIYGVLKFVLGIPDKDMGTAETKRVAAILTKWRWRLKNSNGKRRWLRP